MEGIVIPTLLLSLQQFEVFSVQNLYNFHVPFELVMCIHFSSFTTIN